MIGHRLMYAAKLALARQAPESGILVKAMAMTNLSSVLAPRIGALGSPDRGLSCRRHPMAAAITVCVPQTVYCASHRGCGAQWPGRRAGQSASPGGERQYADISRD
jgi:hypothetical protein